MEITELTNLKKKMHVKKVKGKDYLYLREKTPFFSKEYYICPYTDKDSEILEGLSVVSVKIITDILYVLFEKWKKQLKTKFVNDSNFLMLELLRFGYNVFLKEFDVEELKQYEEVVYTRYVYGTTNIEGNTYTLRETGLTLNEGLTVEGKKKREFYEVENYAKLKKYLEIKKKTEISLELMKDIHRIIMDNIDINYAGEFRKIQAGITGTEFMPTPPPLVEDALKELVDWYNKNQNSIYPIELIAIFHQKFEEIHPFSDGNGRTGREIVRIMLKNFGFPSIFIGPKDREEYLKSLDAGNEKDYSKITKFLIKNLLAIHDSLIKKASEKITKTDFKKNPEISDKQKQVLEKFIERINKIKIQKQEGDYDFKNM